MGALGRSYYIRNPAIDARGKKQDAARQEVGSIVERVRMVQSCAESFRFSCAVMERSAVAGVSIKEQRLIAQHVQERSNLAQSCAELALSVRQLMEDALDGLVLGETPEELGLEALELDVLREALGYPK